MSRLGYWFLTFSGFATINFGWWFFSWLNTILNGEYIGCCVLSGIVFVIVGAGIFIKSLFELVDFYDNRNLDKRD